MSRYIITLSFVLILICVGQPQRTCAQLSFTPLGDLDGGLDLSQAWSISRDGTIIAGFSSSDGSPRQAVIWRGEEIMPIGDLPGGELRSEARDAVMLEGRVTVVGNGRGPNDEAFVWNDNGNTEGQIEGLGFVAGGTFARCISSDGRVIAGRGGYNAVRWIDEGEMETLSGLLENGEAWDVSSDGTVIVGRGRLALDSDGTGFRWTEDEVVTIPSLPGGEVLSEAFGVSADGSIVVGRTSSADGQVAYRWTAESGTVSLGDLPGGMTRSQARATNADGTIIVGQGNSSTGDEAFIWTSSSGMRSLRDVLDEGGADIDGWTLLDATDVSDDGTRIVGFGLNPDGDTEAWLATIAERDQLVDHFKAYDIRDKRTEQDSISVMGQFDDDFVEHRIGAITHFATPVRKNREPIYDPQAHLAFITLDRVDEPRRQVELRNQFGEFTIVTRESRWLLTPSEKVESGSGLSEDLDHYKVYAVDRQRSAEAKALYLEDQFISEEARLGPLVYFAVPVTKRHDDQQFDINNPEVHLAIYAISGTENVEEQRPAINQFGEFELDIFQGRFLCVPSEKLSWEIVKDE